MNYIDLIRGIIEAIELVDFCFRRLLKLIRDNIITIDL